jgi:2-polyprenyl-3-methyl-5-hydroxy-6-metoxy-1,4-benzoquinol methylase
MANPCLRDRDWHTRRSQRRVTTERPGLREVVELISKRSPLQRKQLSRYLSEQDPQFWGAGDRFVEACHGAFADKAGVVEVLARAYLSLCKEMLAEQVHFLKTGRYSAESATVVGKTIYQDDARMRNYVLGLAVSQFLWPNHYEIWKYFSAVIRGLRGCVRTYLEVGAGHGLFLAEAIRCFPESAFEVVDISAGSLTLCRAILRHLVDPPANLRFSHADFTTRSERTRTFDFVVMGELLEHVDDPLHLLRTARAILAKDGKLFLTTCSNCPAVDHVYLFRDLDDIRNVIRLANFNITDERSWPIGNSPTASGTVQLGHNYAAVLRP